MPDFVTSFLGAGVTVTSVAGRTGAVVLVKADVGLGSADNTADAAKNVLTATKLLTARTINGVAFDGTAAITINAVDSTARVPVTRLINTTAPLTGGGDLSADRTLSITAASGTAAGSMAAADFTKLAAISGTNTGDQTTAGTANEITVTNGSTSPIISLPAAVTLTGKTLTGGTFSSPALVTPAIGTPASGTLTNCTGLPNTGVVGLGSAALKNTGTSGDAVPVLNGAATTWGAAATFGGMVSSTTGGGAFSGYTSSTPSHAVLLQSDATTSYFTAWTGAATAAFWLEAANFLFRVASVTKVTLTSTGFGCVSATTASAANVYQASDGSPLLRSTSSIRYKRDVETLQPEYADAALKMRPVFYRSKAEADNPDWGYWGLIAEEVAEIDPRLVHYAYLDEDYDTVEVAPATDNAPARTERRLKSGAKLVPDGVQYERLTVLLLDIVKRQGERIAALEAAA